MEALSPTGSLGARLRLARELAGISARELDRIARSRGDGLAARVESGARSNLEAGTAEEYAVALGLSLDWLISGIGQPPSEKKVRAAVEAARAVRAVA